MELVEFYPGKGWRFGGLGRKGGGGVDDGVGGGGSERLRRMGVGGRGGVGELSGLEATI